MQVLTWNVRFENKAIFKGLKFIYSLKPDVICLQEFPQNKLQELIESTDYYVSLTEDFISYHKKRKKKQNGYIVTLTKRKPRKTEVFSYFEQSPRSLLNLFYKKIARVDEQHKALEVTITDKNKPLKIINARLSCAVPSLARLMQLGNLLEHADSQTIFTGDFNIVDGLLFRFLTGWSRAYTLRDYRTKEREKAEALFSQYYLNNIFERIRTSIAPFPHLQLDHILVPKSFKIAARKKYKKTYRSDHHILSAIFADTFSK